VRWAVAANEKPEREGQKTVDREVVVKVNRWVKRFQELQPGEAFAVFEPKAARLVLDYARVNQIPHTVVRFRGGGWRIGR
jgi:hypothetical protein